MDNQTKKYIDDMLNRIEKISQNRLSDVFYAIKKERERLMDDEPTFEESKEHYNRYGN